MLVQTKLVYQKKPGVLTEDLGKNEEKLDIKDKLNIKSDIEI